MTADHEKPESITAMLDASADSLDGATLSKLQQARSQALASANASGGAWWLPAGAVTAASAAAVISVWLGVVAPQARVNTLEDVEMLAAAESTEMFEQLDFYDWLESQQQRNKIDAG